MSLVEDFAELFEGRKDAYGTEDGGCARMTDDPRVPADGYDFLYLSRVAQHLDGERPMGVYPMVPTGSVSGRNFHDTTWSVKWGCVDFDVITPTKPGGDFHTEGEAHDAARTLVVALDAFGVQGWIERTRSGGRHVWVFAREWVAAATMRRALLVASEVAGTPTREVNPKNEGFADPNTLGNYVRLPYPGDGSRLVYFPRCNTPDEPFMDCQHFVDAAMATRARVSDLEDMAKLYAPPAAARTFDIEEVEVDAALERRMGPLARKIMREGPLEHSDRSTTLVRLAHLCREDDLSPDDAYAVLQSADLSWGKFHARADGERRLQNMVEHAYIDWEG